MANKKRNTVGRVNDSGRRPPLLGEQAMTSVEPKTVRPAIAVASKKQADSSKKAVKKSAKATKKAELKGKKSAAELKAAREERERKLDALLIQPLIKPSTNPCKPGTFCFAQVAAALTSKTVVEAKQKLAANKENPTPERHIEIAWMVKKGYIKTVEA
jgi:hypothetical protein